MITATQACIFLGEKLGLPRISRATLCRLQKECGLPHCKIGGRVSFDPAALERWVQRRTKS